MQFLRRRTALSTYRITPCGNWSNRSSRSADPGEMTYVSLAFELSGVEIGVHTAVSCYAAPHHDVVAFDGDDVLAPSDHHHIHEPFSLRRCFSCLIGLQYSVRSSVCCQSTWLSVPEAPPAKRSQRVNISDVSSKPPRDPVVIQPSCASADHV